MTSILRDEWKTIVTLLEIDGCEENFNNTQLIKNQPAD